MGHYREYPPPGDNTVKLVLSGRSFLSGRPLESVKRRWTTILSILLHKTCTKRTFQVLLTPKLSARTSFGEVVLK